MIGPGSDTWGLPDGEEIISNDTPLQRYFSGILFPNKDTVATQAELDAAELQSETEIDDYEDEQKTEDEDNGDKPQSSNENESDKISKTNFFPTNIGLSVCVPKDTNSLEVTFSFGLYYQPKNKDIKIKISEQGYRSFFDENIPYQLPFKDILKYKDGFMFLERELGGFAGGKGKSRSGEYLAFDEYKKTTNLRDSSAEYFVDLLERIINQGRIWKRINYSTTLEVPVQSTKEPIPLVLEYDTHKNTKVGYNLRVINQEGRRFVKIQLVNLSEKHPANRFSNKNETLNVKSLFQAQITVNSTDFLPFENKNAKAKYFEDDEAKELDFIYRSVKNYAIGHNCSTTWDGVQSVIKTTFLPIQDIKDVTNTFGKGDKKLNDTLNIHNLSVWGFDQKTTIEHLNYFVNQYSDWIDQQKVLNKKESQENQAIGGGIIKRQIENLNRLKSNIQLLTDDDAFRAFQLANTAMFIQLITSNDTDYGKTEKELSEAPTQNLNDLFFFQNYDAEQRISEGKIKFIPAYRPFQLAFLLLSIDGVVNPEGKSRKEIVDLIWFPTGGGKTEAYLAVTALTIAFRRLKNEEGYGGTSVIMRYTLRLLTAQQFERASRLISALEFLRKQFEFSNDLKDEPITIGLWVGMGSTPNKVEEAKKQINAIESECEKKNGNPQGKNTFQINSCPWCGTKLITKKPAKRSGELKWAHGFSHSKKNGFTISCVNDSCAFSDKIPVQVVDEELYENPPTLLFGTVDKFAMLAWQEKAHNFFNSLVNDKLPPDLIIQDELHLLNGPLGSITGIFESVIESLATKNGIAPKIIASTATTRNTQHQVEKLYGNRSVNVFPPSGIHYSDSFFARESNTSKRRYIGFLPTGKTSTDTQLQLLAHLLVARLEVYAGRETKDTINNYWTIVSYYNSLKDVGKIFNKVGDEVSTFTSTLQHRLSNLFQGDFRDYTFNYFGIPNRTQELTSRVESTKIKSVLSEIEKPFKTEKIDRSQIGNTYINDVVDFVLATNMISVGIDISKLNVMLLNGMPKNIAEYIQASSRVGRSTQGLAISLLNPNRAREKSYFEHFNNFHQAFYKSVEPLSITPFTENTIEKMITSLMVAYVRNKLPGRTGGKDVVHFQKEDINGLKLLVKERFGNHSTESNWFEKRLDELAYDWIDRVRKSGVKEYKQLLKKPSEKDENQDWVVMQSMREIDSNTFINIKANFGNGKI
ncbi:helicase [Sinomicrobium soli]|nr:helicase [Sinomicrobium sp. N-1-3-6]